MGLYYVYCYNFKYRIVFGLWYDLIDIYLINKWIYSLFIYDVYNIFKGYICE